MLACGVQTVDGNEGGVGGMGRREDRAGGLAIRLREALAAASGIPVAHLVGLLLGVTLLLTLHKLWLGPRLVDGVSYPALHNFYIYTSAWTHLLTHQDLYIFYPGQSDLFMYSPTFALAMAPFSLPPHGVGAALWNLLNAGLYAAALTRLPGLERQVQVPLLLFCSLELVTALQNAQSNPLIAGLILLAFAGLEQRRIWSPSLYLLLAIFIKPFAAVALLLYVFYPRKPLLILASGTWFLVLLALPLLVIEPAELGRQYQSWARLVLRENRDFHGLSLFGWLQAWFGLSEGREWVRSAALLLLMAPLARLARHREFLFRLGFLGSLLIWMVILNHKAESPTFIIAVTGVALGYLSQPRTWVSKLLAGAVLLFTQLSPTDIFPGQIKHLLVHTWQLKALACILAWLWLSGALLAAPRPGFRNGLGPLGWPSNGPDAPPKLGD